LHVTKQEKDTATELSEEILNPTLRIVDPHHHLWDRAIEALAALGGSRYLLDELLMDLDSGHDVCATVYVEAASMYRADGPSWLRPVGETEFANGVAAMSASRLYGTRRACAGIVSHADLRLGEHIQDVLEAHIRAGGDRFRGIRQGAAWDADPSILGAIGRIGPGLYADRSFRSGFRRLAPLGVSFDAWLLQPQIPDLVDLVRAFPDTQIILDHVGAPLGVGVYSGRRVELFPVWKRSIQALSQCANVAVKLGGLGMPLLGLASYRSNTPATSEQLAVDWKPYVETCIEAFGPNRCMFESNFPVDRGTCSYTVLWNAFKLIAKSYSEDEKTALFSGTAQRVYRLSLP
jgi:L-fuconolactonase